MPPDRQRRGIGGVRGLVGYVGSSSTIIALLTEALTRAENDETIAICIGEVRRQGDDLRCWNAGHGDRLIATTTRLLRDIMEDDEQ